VKASDDGTPLEYRIRVRHQGRDQVIEARLVQAMPFALGEPNDIILGAAYPAVPLGPDRGADRVPVERRDRLRADRTRAHARAVI